MADPAKPGRVISFYSYKGGTGRSLALANMAWILAHNGYRVVAVDWDLEAPGLHRYFRPFLLDKQLASSDGLIDFVSQYTAAAIRPGTDEPVSEDWYVKYADLTRYAVSLEWSFPGRGRLDLIPAGRQVPTYATLVNSFNWQNFYDRLGGWRFLEAAKAGLRDEYDFILIDSRTGVSDTAGICTVQMPDDLVVCFTFNNQSIEGASAVAQSARDQRRKQAGARPLRIFPVPMRVDQGEQDKLKVRRELARHEFADLLEHIPRADRAAFWGDVEIPYMPYLAYEEVLSTFKEDASDPKVALSAILRVTRRVTGLSLDYRLIVPPEKRDEVLAAFAETSVPAPPPAPVTGASATLSAPAPPPAESASAQFVRRAEAAYLGLTPAEQAAMRRLMMRLTTVPSAEQASEPTRRRVSRDDLGGDGKEGGIVAKLQSAGLLVVDPDRQTVEPAHDAIVREWPRMAAWIAEDRDFLLWRERFDHRVRAWDSDHEGGDLLRGSALHVAEQFLDERPDDFNEDERLFIVASTGILQREAVSASRSRWTGAALLGGILLVAALSVWTLQRRSADQESGAKLLGAARAATDPLEAALVLAETGGMAEPTAWADVVAAVAAQSIPQAVLAHRDAIHSAEFSSDGQYLATAGADGTLRVWEAARGVLRGTLPLPAVAKGGALYASFSSDGSVVRAVSDDRRVTWRWHSQRASETSLGPPTQIPAVLATGSADHQVLLAANASGYEIWPEGDVERKPGHRFKWPSGPPVSVALSPSGEFLVTGGGDGRVKVFTTDSPVRAQFCAHAAPVIALSVSPDGTLLATADTERTARVWNTSALGPAFTLRPAVLPPARGPGCEPDRSPERSFGQSADIRAIAVHQAGPWLAVAIDGGITRIHALAAPDAGETAHATLRGHRGPLRSVAFSSDGQWVATASADATVRVWRIARQAGGPEAPPAAWGDVADWFKRRTSACLSVDQRQLLIGELLAAARSGFEACERRNGRGGGGS